MKNLYQINKLIFSLTFLLFFNAFSNIPKSNEEIKKYITTEELIEMYDLNNLVLPFDNLSLTNYIRENDFSKEDNYEIKQNNSKRKKAIIVGATSGIGRYVAIELAKEGYDVGLVGRKINILNSIQKQISTKSYIKQIDITQTEQAQIKLNELIQEMGGLDLMFISIRGFYSEFNEKEKYNQNLIEVDALGFFIAANVAINFFEKQNHGHLVGISSIDGIRGNATNPVYSACKAFVSRYLEGIRNYMIQNKIPIYITDIIPGWVDTDDIKHSQAPKTYWVASTEKAIKEIMNAIKKKKKKAYITKRWQIIAILMKIIPDYLYNKFPF